MAGWIYAGPGRWQSAGGNSLSGFSSGVIQGPVDEGNGLVTLQADLATTPTARLLVNVGAPADVSEAPFLLLNGANVTIGIWYNQPIQWALLNTSDVPINGGAHDWLRIAPFVYIP